MGRAYFFRLVTYSFQATQFLAECNLWHFQLSCIVFYCIIIGTHRRTMEARSSFDQCLQIAKKLQDTVNNQFRIFTSTFLEISWKKRKLLTHIKSIRNSHLL